MLTQLGLSLLAWSGGLLWSLGHLGWSRSHYTTSSTGNSILLDLSPQVGEGLGGTTRHIDLCKLDGGSAILGELADYLHHESVLQNKVSMRSMGIRCGLTFSCSLQAELPLTGVSGSDILTKVLLVRASFVNV